MAITLDIREQPRLPLLKQLEITADGLHHRLFRSMVTLSVVVLAIAFLMNILTESMIARSTKVGVFALSERTGALNRFTGFFRGPVDEAGLRDRLVAAPPGTWQAATIGAWLALGPQQYTRLHELNSAAERHFRWLEDLSMAHRRLLVGNRSDMDALLMLADSNEQARFGEAIRDIPTLALPTGLLEFAGEFPDYQAQMAAATQAFNQRLDALREQLAQRGATLTDWLASSAGDAQEKVRLIAFLHEQSVQLQEQELTSLLEDAADARRNGRLLTLLSRPGLPMRWQRQFNQILTTEQALLMLAKDPARAAWLAGEAAPSAAAAPALGAEEIQQAARRLVNLRQIDDLEERLVAAYGQETGIGTNVFWLIIVSFLVCIVGIANAMLVSVLERFHEIATMKCLGALDSFIAVLFLLEAAFLGMVGGIIGVVIGLAIGVGRMFLSYGGWVGRFFPWSDLLGAAGLSVVAGLALATLAAIYPAFMASRMPPMEAMRVE